MRNIEGYVLIAKTEHCEFLFGEPRIQGVQYENIQTNRINPFKTICEARKAAKPLSNVSEILRILLGELSMKIAETPEEIDFFSDKSNLIVIKKEYDNHYEADILLGPLLNENATSAYPLSGAFLCDNGHTAYRKSEGIPQTPFDRALYQLREINRQGGDAATIAQFNLKRFVEVFRK